MDSDAALPSQGGTISARTKACQHLFSMCLSPATPRSAEWPAQWFQMRQAELNLWAYGLQALGTSKASLDYRVRDRNDVRLIILGLLSALCEDLLECLRIDEELFRQTAVNDASSSQPEGEPEDDGFGFFDVSDDGSEVDSHPSESGDTHFGSQRFSIRLTITELAHFSSMMRRSGTEFRFKRADSRLVESEYLAYQEELARSILLGSIKTDQGAPFDYEMFQSANGFDRLTTVQKRLIRGNILRQNRIVHATKNMRSSKAPPAPGPKGTPKNLLSGTVEDTAPNGQTKSPAAVDQTIPKINLPAKQSEPSLVESRMTGLTAQTATEIGQHFKSDLLAAKSTPSVATKVTRTGAFQDYPRCPEPISEEFIQCPYCADMLPSDYTRNVIRWKGHVAQDILPYMCVFDNCSTPEEMYLTSEDLLKHVQDHHSTLQWVCSQCARSPDPDRSRNSTFHTMAAWQAHTGEAHKKLVPDSSLPSLAKFSEARVLEPISCPLCAFTSEGTVQKTLDQHIIQHIHEFALRSLPWGTKGNDAKSVSNTRTAESDSTDMSDDTASFEDDMDHPARFAKLKDIVSRLHQYAPRDDRPVYGKLMWSRETESEVIVRLRNLSDQFLDLYYGFPMKIKMPMGDDQRPWLPLVRLGDMLCVTTRYVSTGRSHSVERMAKRDSYSSWRDGSSHTILTRLDEIQTEMNAVMIGFGSHRPPEYPSIRPDYLDVPLLNDGEPFHSAPIESTIASDGKFLVVLSGPSASGKTRNAASYALSQDPDLRVFWIDVRALELEDATGISQFDRVFGQIGLQLLEMNELLSVLAIADRGAAFVEAMLYTMNNKSKERWLVILDGVNKNMEAFFAGVRLPGSPIRGMAILTTRETAVPASLGFSQIHARPYNLYEAPGADNQFDNIYLPGDIVPRRPGKARATDSKDPFRSIVINLIRPTPVSSPTLEPETDVVEVIELDLDYTKAAGPSPPEIMVSGPA